MMRVLLVVRWPVGGIRTYIHYIYSQWEDRDVELHFVVPNVPEIDVLAGQLRHLNCHWHKTAPYDPGFVEFLRLAGRIRRAYAFDLVHAHGFTSALAVGWRPWFGRTPAIFTSHDVINHGQLAGIQGLVKREALSLAINRFDVIHSVSHSAQENLLDELSGINRERCVVIENGIDTERFFQAAPESLKPSLGLRDEQVLIGFFGRFMSQKGFTYLIDAIQGLDEEAPGRYHVVCFGSGSYIEAEKQVIRDKGLSHLFHFNDPVPDIAPYIKGCDIVAMPSLWEACGLLAMEVLTAGVPLVAGICSGLSEVCRGSPAVMVEPKNIEDFRRGIYQAVALEPAIVKQYADTARNRYNIDRTRQRLQDIYQRLVFS